MKCNTSKYENDVTSFYKRMENDYGKALVQYWIEDHIQKAKQGLPPYLMEIINRNTLKNKPFDSITVLDLGCGWGEYVANCLINGLNCYGIDKDETLWFGNRLLEENHLPCQFVQGNAFSLPFKKEKFDIIFSYNSLEHIEDPESVFRGIYFILKENGIFFFSFPNALYPLDGHTMLWGVPYLPHDLAKIYVKLRRKRKKVDQWDVWYHGKGDIIRWLRIIGFRKTETFIHFDNSKNKRNFLKNSILDLMTKLGMNPYTILSLKAPMVFMVAEK